jgi:hypothetical protein
LYSNNTGAYSFLERIYGTPFYEVLTLRTRLINYLKIIDRPYCGDEIMSIGWPCFQHEPYIPERTREKEKKAKYVTKDGEEDYLHK